jgi:glycerol-3-phosphate cytidylyltransferase
VHKKVTPIIPLSERLEIVRNVQFVDMAYAAMTNDKTEIWRELRFNVLFKGNDWQGTEKGIRLERDFAALGVEVAYFRIRRRRRAARCAGLCRISRLWPIVPSLRLLR